jgi:hypothetical protein
MKIRGNTYVQVHERIKFFRQEAQYKNWCISTEFPMLTAEEALCRCTITDRDGIVVAVGHAHETKSSSHVNKTSYVENCETSAVGRALGILGIGIDDSIASGDEVEMAIAKQEEASTPAPKQKPEPKAAPKAAPKAEPVVLDSEEIVDAAINHIKGRADKQKVFDRTIKKYGDVLTEQQIARIKKFVG